MTEDTNAAVDQFVVKQIRHVVIVMAVGGLGVLVLIALARIPDMDISIVWPSVILGGLGGVTSNVLRLQRLRASADEVETVEIDQRLAAVQIYFSPILGGLFAGLLYFVFLAGLLKGDVFPNFECGEGRYEDFESLFCGPNSRGDAALMLVWSFIAGFAERFVPNFLDGLVGQRSEPQEST